MSYDKTELGRDLLTFIFPRLITLFLYMVGELSAFQQIVTALTGLDGLPALIVQVVVTTIYTSLGGFRVSFITDTIQGTMVVALIVIAVITVGTKTELDKSLIDSSKFLEPSLLGWQLLYILPVAILTNDFFLSHFWMRAFASRSDKDLKIGVSIAAGAVFCILVLVGVTGLLAAWSGIWPGDPPQLGSIAFFMLLEQLPSWVVGIVLFMTVVLSTAAFDSFQSAMVSTASNDMFRNRLPLIYIRIMVVLCIIPAIVVAIKSPSVLQIFLISDLVSAAAIPVLMMGLWDKLYWWSGLEVIVGGLGGIFSIWIFGTIYYGSAYEGGQLILLENGLYANDWSVFGWYPLACMSLYCSTQTNLSHTGAFLAAPLGGLIAGFIALGLRLGYFYIMSRVRGHRFTALDRPAPRPARPASPLVGDQTSESRDGGVSRDVEVGGKYDPASDSAAAPVGSVKDDAKWWKIW